MPPPAALRPHIPTTKTFIMNVASCPKMRSPLPLNIAFRWAAPSFDSASANACHLLERDRFSRFGG